MHSHERLLVIIIVDVCQGIFITRVADDGPSSLAGLRAGDRLLSVGLSL